MWKFSRRKHTMPARKTNTTPKTTVTKRPKAPKESIAFNPFDVTMKSRVKQDARSWVIFAGDYSVGEAELLEDKDLFIEDSDLTTVTTTCDKVIRVGGASPYLLHLEFEAGGGSKVPKRCCRYNDLLDYEHNLLVETTLILLRKEADDPSITGVYERLKQNGTINHLFHYKVIRVWELPVEYFLNGGIGTLPLAPLSNVSPEDLPFVMMQIEERIKKELPQDEIEEFWTDVYLLLGLKYENEKAISLMKGVVGMEASSTYKAIVERGILIGETRGIQLEARNVVLNMGKAIFGEPSQETIKKIESVPTIEELHKLQMRLILGLNTWEEFFLVDTLPIKQELAEKSS